MRIGNVLLLLGLAGGLITVSGPAGAGNWDRFRGPNGTGVASDREVPVHFGEQDGVLWKTAIPGQGNSSPVVWGDRVFLQTASADGKERQLLCLGTADGRILWSRSAAGARGHTHPRNTLASSTPATDGVRVYALFWDGADLSLRAYDFQGNPAWERDLGRFTSQHGAGASPIVYKDRVFLADDQDGSSVLLAFDSATGKTVWQARRPPFRACYSTPFIREAPGENPELIVASTAGITSYDPATGTENWNWAWRFTGKMPLRTVGSPVAGRGIIFANSGDGSGERHTVAVKLGGKGDEPRLAWESKRTLPYVPTMLSWGDYLYFVNDQGVAGCLVAATGETVWNQRLGEGMTASPVLIDGKVYAAGEEGNVYVFEAAPHYRLLAKNRIGEPVAATPAVAANRLFIRGKDHLFCIGKAADKPGPSS